MTENKRFKFTVWTTMFLNMGINALILVPICKDLSILSSSLVMVFTNIMTIQALILLDRYE